MLNLNWKNKNKNKWWPRGKRKSKHFMKIQFFNLFFKWKYKSKTLQEQGRENNKILYILCQVVWRARKKEKRKKKSVKKYQGGLASAWNAFLLNVFNSMGYLRWRAKLFHAKEPEKEKLVLKISILVLGKSCLFPWTWRRSDGIMRCGALPWTTFLH